MRILALNATAGSAASVALWTDGETICRESTEKSGGATAMLAMVEELLQEAGMTMASLDAIAASIGPGAFTGVRVTVAVAQGLAFGASLPVLPITTLESLAHRAFERTAADCALACMDARMNEVYWAWYTPDARLGVAARGAPQVGAPEQIARPQQAGGADPVGSGSGLGSDIGSGSGSGLGIGIGSGFAAYPFIAGRLGVHLASGAERAVPQARGDAALGALRFAAGAGRDAAELLPLYVRDKVAATEAERAASLNCHNPRL